MSVNDNAERHSLNLARHWCGGGVSGLCAVDVFFQAQSQARTGVTVTVMLSAAPVRLPPFVKPNDTTAGLLGAVMKMWWLQTADRKEFPST